jgi:hypothetical protein
MGRRGLEHHQPPAWRAGGVDARRAGASETKAYSAKEGRGESYGHEEGGEKSKAEETGAEEGEGKGFGSETGQEGDVRKKNRAPAFVTPTARLITYGGVAGWGRGRFNA